MGNETVSEIVHALCLEEHIDLLVRECSGGTRRKIALAVAMIGSPSIVLLDEPSCGVDPASRRSLWNFLASNMHERCILLTTHSMEEAETLCTTIAIMKSGELACIGSSQHLLSRFGTGYQLELRVQDGTEDDVVDAFVREE